jgi:triosephosphate isomerase (TIM)
VRPRSRTSRAAPLGRPLLLLNLKGYPSAIGPRADRLVLLLAARAKAAGVPAAVAPSLPDLGRIALRGLLPVLSPHSDGFAAGPCTGWVVPEALAAAGATGSLLNHSEHRLPFREIERTVARLHGSGLCAVVCAQDTAEVARVGRTGPEYVAVEPPELIGGKVSVSTARPELIADSARALRRAQPQSILLCGAGVRDRNDVSTALRLGAEGILVSSAIACAPRAARAIDELLAGF